MQDIDNEDIFSRLAQIHHDAFTPYGLRAWGVDEIRDLCHGNSELILSSCEGRPVGFALLHHLDITDIITLCVDPAFQGQGYAKQLVAKTIEAANIQACTAIILDVNAGNTLAQRLYKSFGFAHIHTRKDYYRSSYFCNQDAYIYHLYLQTAF